MTRLLIIVALLSAGLLLSGCLPSGYYHTHPCVGPDGTMRTLRHWHASAGYAGYHTHPFPNPVHKKMKMTQGEEPPKGIDEEEEE